MLKTELEWSAVLCYVRGPWAYFTTQPLENQTGDAWHKKVYEHNSSPPYNDYETPARWKIVRVAFDVEMKEPCTDQLNSPYSVDQINRGDIAWLRPYYEGVPIPAGTTLRQFIELIELNDGVVYLPSRGERPK